MYDAIGLDCVQWHCTTIFWRIWNFLQEFQTFVQQFFNSTAFSYFWYLLANHQTAEVLQLESCVSPLFFLSFNFKSGILHFLSSIAKIRFLSYFIILHLSILNLWHLKPKRGAVPKIYCRLGDVPKTTKTFSMVSNCFSLLEGKINCFKIMPHCKNIARGTTDPEIDSMTWIGPINSKWCNLDQF